MYPGRLQASSLLLAAAIGIAVLGCGSPESPAEESKLSTTTDSSMGVTTTNQPETTTSTTAAPTTVTSTTSTSVSTTTTMALSSEAIAYAKGLGGRSHSGETLYFMIGASVESERRAQALLDAAIPLFGDMQSYYVVQRSDNFEGLSPGWWIVVEAYRNQPSIENIDFGRRAFPNAYVKRATVRTSDPIPVYEDLVGP